MIKLVAIDFDGTLSMTEEATFLIENKVATQMGHKPMTRSAHKKNWGVDLETAALQRFPGINVEEFIQKLYIAHEEAVAQGVADHVPLRNLNTLDALLSRNIKLALLTSRSIGEAKHLLHNLHPFNSRMEKFYYKENSDFLKPDPRVFIKVLRDFKLQPQEVVYVGDAVSDAVAAKGAGLHFVAVLESGVRVKNDFKGIPVDYFATTFVEAANYILSLTSES